MAMQVLRPGSPLGSTVLFLGGGREWTVDDALADAHARGALDHAIAETLAMAAAEDEADADDDEVQAASEKFRYDHDLISAGETEEWLAARAMTIDDFADWIYGQVCLRHAGRSEATPDDASDRLIVHLWMSGTMDAIADEFRRRVAAAIELASDDRDAAYDRVVGEVLTADARRRKLAILRQPLRRLEVDWLELDSEAAAREATLCVRNDGETLAAVAAEAGFATKRESMWVEDAPQQTWFGKAGDLVGPMRAAGGFRLCQIVRRIEPSLDDREVSARVDAALLDESFSELCARHTPLPVIARTTQ